NSPVKIPIVLAVPTGPIGRDLSDVLIVLLLVVIVEVEDEAVRRGIIGAVVYFLGLPRVVVPVSIRVGLELLFLRFAAVVVVEIGGPRNAFEAEVHEAALLPRVQVTRAWNGQVHEERLAGRPVLGFLRDLDRRIYGRSGGVPDGGYGIGDRPLGKENLPRGLGIE